LAPLIVLALVTVVARFAGAAGARPLQSWAAATRVGLAVMFCFTAAAHFNSMRADMIRMVPPGVPNAGFMVTFTGVCEVLGAIGLLVRPVRRIAGMALILFLLAVLPANIHAAQSNVTLRGAPATPLVPRVAMQALFIGLVWWSSVRGPAHQRSDTRVGGFNRR
jgi:uncharacterized membrane protein